MDFPLTDLVDQDACYHKLVSLLHPDGLACPFCKKPDHSASTDIMGLRSSTTAAPPAAGSSTPSPESRS